MYPEPPSPQNVDTSLADEKFGVPAKTTISLIVVSLICGALGGVYGSRYLGSGSTAFPASGGTVVVKEESATVNVVEKASPAVVSIVISKDLNKLPNFGFYPFGRGQSSSPNLRQIGAGTGFFVSEDGTILTNRHVVDDEQAEYSVITSDDKTYSANVVARDPVNDLAILKINIKDAPTLTLADSSQLQIGQHVVAIGNSLGQYQNTVTSGIVSGIGRRIVAGGNGASEQLEGVIQTDAAINPGNSGGPLLNLAGQVIGINTAVDLQGQSVGFAIPANDAAKAIASFKKSGKIARPFLGIRYVMISKLLADSEKLARDRGALIVSDSGASAPAVLPDSPAEKAGLRENDIILEVNGKILDQNNTLAGLLKNFNPGDTIALKIYREGSENIVNVTLGEVK